MPSLRAALASMLVVGLAMALSFLVASAASRAVDAAIAPALMAALVIVAVFAWRAPEGLLTFVMVALFAETAAHWLAIDLQPYDELAIPLLAIVAGLRNGLPRGRLRLGVPEVGLGVLVGMAVISSIIADVPFQNWLLALALLIKGVAILYLVSWSRLDLADAERMGVVVVGVTAVVFILGVIEFLDPVAFQRALGLPAFDQVRGDIGVVKSIFLHPAAFGWLTAFASLLLYARFIAIRSWWLLPIAGILNIGTVVSGRRTPVIGVLLALCVGLVWNLRRVGLNRSLLRAWSPVVAVLVLLTFVSIPNIGGFYRATVDQYIPPADQMASILSDAPDQELISSVPPRTALYVGSVAVARDHAPFGAGLGRFGSFVSRYDYSPLYERYGLNGIYGLSPQFPIAVTDTFWPMLLAETGIIGLLGALTFFGGVAVRLWQIASRSSTMRMQALALGALLVFIEGLVRSLTSAVFVAPPIAYFVLGAAGLAIAVHHTADEIGVHDGGQADQALIKQTGSHGH